MIAFHMLAEGMTPEALGFIPSFLAEDAPRPAAQQIDAAYQHGGGWSPMRRFRVAPDGLTLVYPGSREEGEEDGVYPPLAIATLHGRERIVFYYSAWTAVFQPDGSFEVSRLD